MRILSATVVALGIVTHPGIAQIPVNPIPTQTDKLVEASVLTGLSVEELVGRYEALRLERSGADGFRSFLPDLNPEIRAGALERLSTVAALSPSTRRQAVAGSKTNMAVPVGASAAADDQDASGAAVLGFQVFKNGRYLASAFVNVGSSRLVSSGEGTGATLRNPGNNGAGGYLKLNWLPVGIGGARLGAAALLGAQAQDWEAPGVAGSPMGGSMSYLNLGVMLQSPIFTPSGAGMSGNSYSVGIIVGPTARWIGGDVTLPSGAAFREAFLGTPETEFWGLDVTLFLTLNSAAPYVKITNFSKDDDIAGLSGTQLTVGVDVLAAAFQWAN